MVGKGTPLVSDRDFCDRFFSNRRSRQFLDRCFKMGSSEIWSDKLKLLHNKAHRDTEKTELNAKLRRCRWHKERQRWGVQISANFWDKCFMHKSLIKLANNLSCSTYQRCLRAFHYFVVNNPPCSPYLCVTLRQSSKLRRRRAPLSLQISEDPQDVLCGYMQMIHLFLYWEKP